MVDCDQMKEFTNKHQTETPEYKYREKRPPESARVKHALSLK
jgi:hypothetical protein